MINNDMRRCEKLFASYYEIEQAINNACPDTEEEAMYIEMLTIYPEYALFINDKALLIKSYEFIDFNLNNYLKHPKTNKLTKEFIQSSFIYKRKISQALMLF